MTWEEKCAFAFSLCAVVFVTAVVGLGVRIPAESHFILGRPHSLLVNALPTSRTLYAVNQSSATRGSISVYYIDRGHNLLKTIPTVPTGLARASE
jgi:hypothetical protein